MSLLDDLRSWVDAIDHGADPIEALSGHLCGPRCWHWEVISGERKEKLLRAPWNQPGAKR